MKVNKIIDSLVRSKEYEKEIPKTVLQKDIELCKIVKNYLDFKKASLVTFKWGRDEVEEGTVVSVDLFEKANGDLGLGITVQGSSNKIYRVPYEDVVGITYKEQSDLKNIYG